MHSRHQTYSPKVFIPLTRLCRDVCAYCTFAHTPKPGQRAYLSPDEVLAIARAGVAAGCKEALFTLGDKPELRYAVAREELTALGHDTTLSYVAATCERVLKETGLLPHVNAGVMTKAEIAMLRRVSASQGLMLESSAARLCERGGPHFGSPDKRPAVRLQTIADAGELKVPFTSGILIGIGETGDERIDALRALQSLHTKYGHLQEIIIQNFRAKSDTRMADHPDLELAELLWTITAAREVFGAEMNIQTPPNLNPGVHAELIHAGINDWGGISPVTIDHVNPEAPWPHVADLRRETSLAGRVLAERLALYPRYVQDAVTWLDPGVIPYVLQAANAEGLARMDDWSPGRKAAFTSRKSAPTATASGEISEILMKAKDGIALNEAEIVRLFAAREMAFDLVCTAADDLRKRTCGDDVTYVVNRNINYTNICTYKCTFCAFSKGSTHEDLRGVPYDLHVDEVVRRAQEAWDRGATEVCLQGGIHPDFTGDTYLGITRAVRTALPDMHIHAFSPLEIFHGATTLNISVRAFLQALMAEGLNTLPGTAAEILDDDVRAILCPDKITSGQWLEIMATAHDLGLRSTSTIMFGHVDAPTHWARHLLKIRALQERTGGFTEFVPLPFVHMEAPLYRRGRARRGPTGREAVLMHAVARLVLHPVLTNIQVSWVKMGVDGARASLQAGANDLGGTLMNESISRAAGTEHGQELAPAAMEELIASIGRAPRHRTTLYGTPGAEQVARARSAAPLTPVLHTPRAPRIKHAAAAE